MTHPSDFAPTTKKVFAHIPHPLPMKERFLKALHFFYSPMKGLAQYFKIQGLTYPFCLEATFMYTVKQHLSSLKYPFLFMQNFFLNGGLTFSSTLSLSSIHSKEWESTITSHVKPRLLLPIVKPVVLGVVTDDWDSDQENFHYFIRPNR